MLTLVLGHILAEVSGQQALPAGTTQQLQYLDKELSMFIHFSICAYGKTSVSCITLELANSLLT